MTIARIIPALRNALRCLCGWNEARRIFEDGPKEDFRRLEYGAEPIFVVGNQDE